MSQKDYKLEIVGSLIGNSLHARALAKKIKTNPMMISRKIKELCDSNVFDYKEEGKNKVYFVKDTAEARTYINMAENYKLIKILERCPFLRLVVDEIQKNKKIGLAILFGSHAKGLERKDSDVDIYIETLDRKIKNGLELIDSKLSIKIGKYDKKNLLIKEIEKNHIILKGVERFYDKF
ncbi:nucleotidyltransferase domain-containing protein [Candidatus Pacearchaeota archaeon]|nr:nucleotidyltransferase domain-containing protein [Candidatus Pacearchaeota archaeon]